MTDWVDYAKNKDLRAVIDPADARGSKNYYINLLHHKILSDNMMNTLQGKRVLDLGCGIGRFTKLLQDGGAEVIGLDSCKEMLEMNTECTTICAPVTKLPLDDASVDVVLSVWTLQYLKYTDLELAIEEINRVLTPGGTVYLIEQMGIGYDSVYPRFDFIYELSFNPKLIKIYSRKIIKSDDTFIGIIRRGIIPKCLFSWLGSFHLGLTNYTLKFDEFPTSDYTDYFMKFIKVV
jgi:SAM-dependent methyltransferase